jgi:hypothetical protein
MSQKEPFEKVVRSFVLLNPISRLTVYVSSYSEHASQAREFLIKR